ncbi:MAG: hypothetical protein ACXVFZ_18490 [Blastococcus sp.]
MATAALTRLESRGSHRRRDVPEPDPRWSASMQFALRDGVLTARRSASGRAA